jgi:hypothetical protein
MRYTLAACDLGGAIHDLLDRHLHIGRLARVYQERIGRRRGRKIQTSLIDSSHSDDIERRKLLTLPVSKIASGSYSMVFGAVTGCVAISWRAWYSALAVGTAYAL